VWGAAIASATVNFAYEYTHSGQNLVAGGYLALLSLFGMVMLHEFLDQFEEGASYIKRANPKFGLRWITWPTNTFCAAVAWHNHPPADGPPANVLNAIANLSRVRTVKRDAREAAILARHQRALAAARRQAELATANTDALPSRNARLIPAAQVDGREPELTLFPAPVDPLKTAGIESDGAGLPMTTDAREDPPGTDVRVPATAATLNQWVGTWMRMCADGIWSSDHSTTTPTPEPATTSAPNNYATSATPPPRAPCAVGPPNSTSRCQQATSTIRLQPGSTGTSCLWRHPEHGHRDRVDQ
jgi:hypothetical protein